VSRDGTSRQRGSRPFFDEAALAASLLLRIVIMTTTPRRSRPTLRACLALFAAVVLPIAALQTGCIGGCGIGAVSDAPDGGTSGATVSNGEVTFEATHVSSSATIELPVKDSADVHETILGASFSGPDAAAFRVVGTYPIDVPAGHSVLLQVTFAPTHVGPASATLMVQTEEMGVSPIQVSGTGT
jgi:hypothetical protein